MNTFACNDQGLEEAAKVILSGGVAIIPTDTVYGLAAHPDFPEAVQRLYTIKGRLESKPIALLASDIASIENFGFSLGEKAQMLAKKHWPGALTIVLANESTTEGFRIPDYEWTRKLIKKCGGVLRVTSANLSGGEDAVEAIQAINSIGLSADVIIDGGESRIGTPSTVVLITSSDGLKILRAGAVNI